MLSLQYLLMPWSKQNLNQHKKKSANLECRIPALHLFYYLPAFSLHDVIISAAQHNLNWNKELCADKWNVSVYRNYFPTWEKNVWFFPRKLYFLKPHMFCCWSRHIEYFLLILIFSRFFVAKYIFFIERYTWINNLRKYFWARQQWIVWTLNPYLFAKQNEPS